MTETSATDNLRRLLDGLRGVGNLHEFAELFGFDWNDDSDWHWHDVAVKMADDLEQAVAATLGSGVERSRTEYAALTAEHVRGTVKKHWHDLPDEYDMPEATALTEYSYDWHAIADELNAALDGGTRWERLFGTPKRAARTSWYMLMCKQMDCDECPIADGCDIATDIYCDDGEAALLEWLRGDAE